MFASARRVVRGALTGIGVVTVGFAGTAGFAIRRRQSQDAAAKKLPEEFILDLDFDAIQLVEQSGPPWTRIAAKRPQLELWKLVEVLGGAAKDERIKALFTQMGPNQSFDGLAQVQELHNAILDFRAQTQGRVATVAYADSFGEGWSGGTGSYYLSTACDQVVMQPSGLLSATGVASTTPFLKRLLDQWEIKALYFRREGYKTAANRFTQGGYTSEHREVMEALMSGWIEQICTGIGQARKLTPQLVKEAIDSAPLSATMAVKQRLLDGIKYRDQAMELLPKPGNDKSNAERKDLPRVSVIKYLKYHEAVKKKQGRRQELREAMKELQAGQEGANPESKTKKDKNAKPVVAVVTAVGMIEAGRGSDSPGPQQDLKICASKFRAATLSETLRKVKDDDNVKSVVLRVDSPGGSAVGSDTIYREVLRMKEAGKPIIVSMGNVAGSGGYYIACPANKIVANPGTITGSIGVLFGKFNADAPLRKYGVDMETIQDGKNAAALELHKDFNDEQLKIVDRNLDDVYNEFMSKVSRGRGMSMEEVKQIAMGKIWTGETALQIGLVDQLGGVKDAILLAKKEAGLSTEDEDAVEVVAYPKPKPFFIQLIQKFNGTSTEASMVALLSQSTGLSFPLQLAALIGSQAQKPDLVGQGSDIMRQMYDQSNGSGVQMKVPEDCIPKVV